MTKRGAIMDEERENQPLAPVEPPKLDYAAPPKKSYESELDKLVRRFTPPSDPELRRWWWRRLTYRAILFGLFALTAFYFGPNLIEFGKLTRPTAADFVPEVERGGVPLVKAVKLYRLDHGRFPKDESDLIPDYLPAQIGGFMALDGIVIGFVGHSERVEYRCYPGEEGWWLSGPWLNGRLPLGLVTVDQSMRPVTRQAN